MIRYVTGDLLGSDAEALVITVNCVGVMGAGLAKQARLRFPDLERRYRDTCRRGELRPGRVVLYRLSDGRAILAVATKDHWRDSSQLVWVDRAAKVLALICAERSIGSIAVPPLGCGLGGLDWRAVEPVIRAAFAPLPHVDVRLYVPRR